MLIQEGAVFIEEEHEVRDGLEEGADFGLAFTKPPCQESSLQGRTDLSGNGFYYINIPLRIGHQFITLDGEDSHHPGADDQGHKEEGSGSAFFIAEGS